MSLLSGMNLVKAGGRRHVVSRRVPGPAHHGGARDLHFEYRVRIDHDSGRHQRCDLQSVPSFNSFSPGDALLQLLVPSAFLHPAEPDCLYQQDFLDCGPLYVRSDRLRRVRHLF